MNGVTGICEFHARRHQLPISHMTILHGIYAGEHKCDYERRRVLKRSASASLLVLAHASIVPVLLVNGTSSTQAKQSCSLSLLPIVPAVHLASAQSNLEREKHNLSSIEPGPEINVAMTYFVKCM
jgi:hypothetical protein